MRTCIVAIFAWIEQRRGLRNPPTSPQYLRHTRARPTLPHSFALSPYERTSLQESLTNSADTVKSAVEGQAGVVAAGSTFVSPARSRSGDDLSGGSNDDIGSGGNRHDVAEPPPTRDLRFRGLEPSKRYVVSLCTESNSGVLSRVTVVEAEAHAEAPKV